MLPQKKLVIFLDSNAGNFFKPPARKALAKMGIILEHLDPNCNLEEWLFICNKTGDIPQQANSFDCGVYTCLYARCLAGLGPMVQDASFPEFRWRILFNEHQGSLLPIDVPAVEIKKNSIMR